jgi:ribosomal protein S18 acetylase RimI-like enzyme
MDSIVFKKATLSDSEQVHSLTKKAFIAYAHAIRKQGHVDALTETIENVDFDIKHKHVYLCLLDGQLAGAVRFEVLSGGIAYLTRLAIDPDIQSIGIGGLLLEKAHQECKKLGVRAITLFTASKKTSSVAFYLKNGYYIHSITRDKAYIRAFMVNEIEAMDELFDYESVVGKR